MADDSPAAPAGSGTGTVPVDAKGLRELLFHARSVGTVDEWMVVALEWSAKAQEMGEALLARAEAAERERDEALLLAQGNGWPEESLIATVGRLVNECYANAGRAHDAEAALAASTEREAGLRALCHAMLSAIEDGSTNAINPETGMIDDAATVFHARLASLAAPEGGTSRPTPPEGTNG